MTDNKTVLQSMPAQASDKLEIVRVSEKCGVGRFAGLVLVNWRTEVTHEDIKAVVELRNDMLSKGTFRGSVHIADVGLPVPDEALRQAARRALQARRENRGAIALVILGEGFGASAIRSVGTAVFALRGAPTRLFANTDEAARWMVEEMAAYEDVYALASACEALRAAP